MTYLPARPDLEQLRHQAKDLLREATRGEAEALARVHAVSDLLILASAQLAIAREYGFESWPKLKREVERREVLNSRDLDRLSSLLAEDPELAVSRMVNWSDHRLGASPLNYIAMIGFDHERLGLPPDLPGTGRVAAALIAAGAPVNGHPGEFETPLMTAASYGDAEVAHVLIEAGADIEARASAEAGGVPGGTALMHAAVFGMTTVLDLLVKAGAQSHGIESAAAVGDISGRLTADTPLQARIRALTFAADHQRLAVIDQLIDAHTPVDAIDEMFGRHALRLAAQNGRPRSVRRLLEHGADPNLRDKHGRTALDLCQPACRYLDNPGHDEVDAILRPLDRRAREVNGQRTGLLESGLVPGLPLARSQASVAASGAQR
jgi:ankyrin repeat protein